MPEERILKLNTFRRRRVFVALLVVAVVAALVGAALGMHLLNKAGVAVADLGRSGPWAFFAMMAVLPAVGFPLAVFNLAAGPIFGSALGVWQTVAFCSGAIAVNVALAYALARYLLRPPLSRLLGWLGYTIPVLPRERTLSFAFLVRITPGPPFTLQSYLLGAAETPFVEYMVASWSVASLYAALSVIGGDALMHRNIRAGLFALALLGVVALGLRWFRSARAPKVGPGEGPSFGSDSK